MNRRLNHARLRIPAFLLFALLFLCLTQGCAQPGLRIYFVRHAEAGHNVLAQWKDKPKSTWPPYVGNANMFSPKGDAQAATLVDKLKGIHFDLIAACPYWRTRHTILPYLQATGQKAELWPELEETGPVPPQYTAAGIQPPPPNPRLFDGVNDFKLPDDEKTYFSFLPNDKKFLEYKDPNNQIAIGNALALSQKVIAMVKARTNNAPKSVLLVGHGDAGSTLLRTLTTSKTLTPNIANASLWMAEEQPNGTFKLKILNDKPYPGK